MIRKRTTLGCTLLLATSLWAAGPSVPSPAQPAASSVSASAWVAVLDNGFSIRHYRREAHGDMLRLYVSPEDDSYVDVPAVKIVELKADASKPIPSASQASRAPQDEPLTQEELEKLVKTASDRHGIDPDLIRSVIAAESSFHPDAISPKGAQGLMQLMPETASDLGVQNAFDPRANVDGGTRYLRELLIHYKGDVAKALAAYNAGPERVEQYNGVPPYAETRAYVTRVIREFNRKKSERKH